MGKSLKEERLGITRYNKQGDLMKVVEYNGWDDITVEFQDQQKEQVKTYWQTFMQGAIVNPSKYKNRLGMIRTNYQGCLMKIIEYHNTTNMIVEFQDNYKYTTQAKWDNFEKGCIKNYYFPEVCGVGIVGKKYSTTNKEICKVYKSWRSMLNRAFNKEFKQQFPTYVNVTCCDEWLLFENFYEWIHNQENYQQWLNGYKFCLDKDILVKGNKIYSPNTCCLVPNHINLMFVKADKSRKDLPIGVFLDKQSKKYKPTFSKRNVNNQSIALGAYETPEEAFQVYKQHKEAYIKQVAQEEYDKGTISKKCYEAMMRWEVEIDD